MATDGKPGDAAAIIEAMERLTAADTIELGGNVRVLAVPRGITIQSIKPLLDEYLPKPARREGTAHLTTLESFIAHVERHKDEPTAVFVDVANRTAPKMIAVLNYQDAGPATDADASHNDHRAVYAFPVSDEWKAWSSSLTGLSQEALATFLEDRIVDVIDPERALASTTEFAARAGLTFASPSRVLDLSRGLTVHVGQQVKRAVNLSTGESTIAYQETHADEGGAPLKIPGGFIVEIPVFRGGVLYQLPMRLRYKVSGGSVTWTLTPSRVDAIWDDAVKGAADVVQVATGLSLFYGTPEI